jgi:hypothetical protein
MTDDAARDTRNAIQPSFLNHKNKKHVKKLSRRAQSRKGWDSLTPLVLSTEKRTHNMLDTAFEALKKFDWGSDLATLAPIEDAVIAAHEKPDARQELENRLIAAIN